MLIQLYWSTIGLGEPQAEYFLVSIPFLSSIVGYHFAVVGKEADLITASSSVGCGFTLAASVCVGSLTIDLYAYDLAHGCTYHVLLHFQVQLWRVTDAYFGFLSC